MSKQESESIKAQEMRDREVKSLEAVFGAPVWLQTDAELSKTRMRLIVVGSLSLSVGVLNLRIDNNPTLLGLHILGLADWMVNAGLFAVTLYLLIHFSWGSWDSIQEWRIRQTGTRQFRDNYKPPSEPRQFTIYTWWLAWEPTLKSVSIAKELEKARLQLEKCVYAIHNIGPSYQADQAFYDTQKAANEAAVAFRGVHHDFIQHYEVFQTQQLGDAIKRFDNCYSLFLKSQNLRWLIFSAAFPLILGNAALVSLAVRFCKA